MSDYATEGFSSLLPQVEPLLERHYAEVAHTLPGMDAPLPMELDVPSYIALEQAGCLRCYTARRQGVLVGFSAFVVSPSNLHHKGLKFASNDVIAVVPESRGLTGKRLMEYACAQLRAEGVQLVDLSIPKVCDWTRLAEHWGFSATETHMQKWL